MAIAPPAAPTGDEPDPSMDDILASIRRILKEDEKIPRQPGDGVLMLDPSMIVEEGEAADKAPSADTNQAPGSDKSTGHEPDLQPGVEETTVLAIADEPVHSGSMLPDLAFPPANVSRDAPMPETPLVAPAAAAAAAHSVGSLVRTLAAERSAAVTRGGLTIEDLVREEVRPVLKEWLDTHLPPLVERMVRAELERVVGRSV